MSIEILDTYGEPIVLMATPELIGVSFQTQQLVAPSQHQAANVSRLDRLSHARFTLLTFINPSRQP